MSAAGIIMDVILMGLLIAALWFGVRLDKRLKGLRAAHDSFARAVADLDQAAMKAHISLKDLRSDADESQELLHGRILVARDLMQKLETQITRSEKLQGEIDRSLEAAKTVTTQVVPALVSSAPAVKPEIPSRIAGLRTDRPSPFKRQSRERHDVPDDPSIHKPSTEPDLPHISENVIASLNDMLRSFEVPRRPQNNQTQSETLAQAVPTRRPPSGDDLFEDGNDQPALSRARRPRFSE